MQYVYIFIGGALGALLRYLISFLNTDGGFSNRNTDSQFDWCLCNGIANSLNNCIFSNHPTLKKAITTGFLGALTTFSTFQLELIHMFDHQQFITLLLYAVTSYVFGILLCYVGIKLGGGLS
ncbi:fluoride efflux transporter CrcB [Staphylococcus aureus]|uniref:fluoride efflux transporter CrcB n=1 Tax=Staphylococcus aureus TaxID=1280 RepID=UPI001CEC8969|nr:fluoride efflux transporter CrcB [Staphylococcus aureus]UCK19047.1 fluoride efflux transporter CrcB [Staphylococcus aureus]